MAENQKTEQLTGVKFHPKIDKSSTWWLNQPLWQIWQILVKMDHLPQGRGEHKKNDLKPLGYDGPLFYHPDFRPMAKELGWSYLEDHDL